MNDRIQKAYPLFIIFIKNIFYHRFGKGTAYGRATLFYYRDINGIYGSMIFYSNNQIGAL